MALHKKYQDVLDDIYRRLPMYQREGKTAYKKDLTNITALCHALDNPQRNLKTIHVAGTNGKGTVSHLIAFILQSQGYKVGLYTSPHYKDFRERIKVDGKLMPKSYVKRFIGEMDEAINTISPSFFEITVAMAFQYFKEQVVDYAVIEVGLGGRLDSTNIITAEISVITNISYDHMDMLGDTLPLIAAEKAGIIKAGVPVIIGESQEETIPIFAERAKHVDAPIVLADQEMGLISEGHNAVIYHNESPWLDLTTMPLKGPFQSKNLVTAFYAMWYWSQHGGPNIEWSKVSNSMGQMRSMVYYIGRWQELSELPTVMVDSAHNEGGIKYLTQFLIEEQANGRHLHVVLGFANDKDLTKILPLFPKYADYYFAKANVPRGMKAELLQLEASKYGLKGKAYKTVRNALSVAKRKASKSDLIFVGGSIFVVAEVNLISDTSRG